MQLTPCYLTWGLFLRWVNKPLARVGMGIKYNQSSMNPLDSASVNLQDLTQDSETPLEELTA